MMARGVGPRIGRQLTSVFGSVEALWQTPAAELEQRDGVSAKLARSLQNVDQKAVEAVVQTCRNSNIKLICLEDEFYPQRLLACDDAPPILFAQGDASVLNNPYRLSVVGARKASKEGRVIARRWSRYCSERGVTVVSGMAYGIDAAAHGGALEGDAGTIAVLGSGLKAVLGEPQKRQVEAITGDGCVVSQYLPEVTARPEQFPQRNRIYCRTLPSHACC